MNQAQIGSQKPINKTSFILVTTIAGMTVLLLQYYLSASGIAGNYMARFAIFGNLSREFAYVLSWGIFTTTIYLLIPLIAIYVLKESPRKYGLSFNKSGRYIYVFAPIAIFPITFIFSKNPDFQSTYPFLTTPNSIDILVYWELIYVLQFFALEFFFRGFLFHSILKFTSVIPASLLASIPYTIIHFVKPTPETIASFFGGVLLCWIAFKYKNIVIGFYLHALLAISMDVFVLYHKGWFNVLSL